MARLKTQRVDGYDLFLLEAMKANGLINLITDDGDFVTVPDITMFTANRNAITQATAQGKILVR